MRTAHRFRAKLLDGMMSASETIIGRRFLNRLGAFLYWRTRGENLDDPDRNGEYRTLDVVMQQLAKTDTVVFDIGANVGDWSESFLGRNPACKIYAFEPVATTFAHITARFKGESRIEVCRAAVSDQPGSCVMRVEGELSGSNSLYRMPGEKNASLETVAAITGDEFAAARGIRDIDYIKIDVEGHEVRALQGFRQLLGERRIRFIQWEYNKTWIPAGASLHELFELLVPAGYRLCKIRPNGLLCYQHYARTLDNYCYSNWLAICDRDYAQMRGLLRIDENTGTDW